MLCKITIILGTRKQNGRNFENIGKRPLKVQGLEMVRGFFGHFIESNFGKMADSVIYNKL